MNSHPLDEWVNRLERVHRDDVVTWRDPLADSWTESEWGVRSIVLRRALWRPDITELADYCRDTDWDVWSWAEEAGEELTVDQAAAKRSWLAPEAEILQGCQVGLVESELLFGMWSLWDDSPCSSSEGLLALTLTPDRAVFGVSTEDSGCFPTPLGLIDARDPIRSAALLLQEGTTDRMDWFGYEDALPSSIGMTGLSPADALRLAVARDYAGDTRFICMPDSELLARFREDVDSEMEEGDESRVDRFLARLG